LSLEIRADIREALREGTPVVTLAGIRLSSPMP
jgi:hypothetical protein